VVYEPVGVEVVGKQVAFPLFSCVVFLSNTLSSE